MQYRCLSNLIWILNKAQKLDFMPYYVVASPILISQIFGHLLDVATLLWLYATERKCCEELAMHSSLTMALCNRAQGDIDMDVTIAYSYSMMNDDADTTRSSATETQADTLYK